MILGLEIGLLVAGLIALVTGKFKLSKERTASGVAARLAGLVLMLPLPLALAVRFLLTSDWLGLETFDLADSWVTWALVELGLALLCLAVGFGIALLASAVQKGREPRPRPPRARAAERVPPAPAPAAEGGALWVVNVETPAEAVTAQPSDGRGAPAPRPVPERPPAARPAPARSSGTAALWVVLGGVVVGLFLCVTTTGGLLAWWLFSSANTRPTTSAGPFAAGGGPVAAVDKNDLGPRQEWGEKPPRFPEFAPPEGVPDVRGGMGPAGMVPPGLPAPGPAAKPEPPPFKPIVIPPPSAPHLNVRPPALAEAKVERMLPSTVGDVAVGGGGRFLILWLPRERQLAVFDVNVARVVKYLPFTDDVVFAAGMDKLLVALPAKNVLQRWDLKTFRREAAAPLGGDGQVTTMAMGPASNGPLLVRQTRKDVGLGPALKFYDVRTLRPLDVKWGNNPGGPLDATYIRASGNGKVFALLGWGPVTLVWDDGRVTITHLLQGGGFYALPSPDGKLVYTDLGIYTDQLRPAAGVGNVRHAMPATHGRYYMAGTSVYLEGDSRPLLTLPEEKPVQPNAFNVPGPNDLALDKRGYFLPDAKLLVLIPLSNDRLVLRRLDVEAGLEASGIDYLFVVSHALVKAKRGATYRYQLAVKSKKGGVKYKLESGPPGMKVSEAGLVTWDVPAGAGGEVDVILSVSDRSGQEVFHTFRLLPGDVGEEQEPLARNEPPAPAPPPEKEPVRPPPVVPPAKPPAPPPPPKPVLPWVRPFPVVRAPQLSADKVEVKLPAHVDDVAVGGGGRYLLLHLPRARQIAVFDVSAARVVGHVPLSRGAVRFAAGRDKLVVVKIDLNVIERWDIATQRREASAQLPVRDRVTAVVMGSASDGPVLVAEALGATRSDLFFVDLATLSKLPIRRTGNGHIHVQELDGVRASADGRVFGIWRANTIPQGIQTLVLQREEARGYYEHNTAGHIVPGPDGQVIYTARGRYTNQVKPLGESRENGPYCLPPAQGRYYLTVEGLDERGRPKQGNGTLAVHRVGNELPVVTLPQVELPPGVGDAGVERLRPDKRILFVPSARVIVVIPADTDRLVLYRFDVEAAMSVPPVAAPPPAPAPAPAPPRKEGAVRELKNLRISRNSYANALAFSPDGRELLAAGDDGRLRRWGVATGKELDTSFEAHPRVSMFSVSVSGDGKLLATSALDRTAKVWDAATNKLLATCTEWMGHVHAALSRDGKVLATGTNRVSLWDAATGRQLGTLDGPPAFIESLAFSPDGKLLACTGSQHTVKLWDMAARKELATLTGHTGAVMAVAFSPDGKTLASAGMDRTVKLWDVPTRKERLTLKGHEEPISSLAFSPDGSLLLSGAGATRFNRPLRAEVKLWDVAAGKCLTDLRGHQGGVGAVAFAPDGKTVATTARDNTVRLWDVSAFTGRK